MASGWGCQYLSINGEITDWCRKLKHKCEPGCKGCIIYGSSFSQAQFSNNDLDERKVKKRSDNPLDGR
jgi:hypothetical protein